MNAELIDLYRTLHRHEWVEHYRYKDLLTPDTTAVKWLVVLVCRICGATKTEARG